MRRTTRAYLRVLGAVIALGVATLVPMSSPGHAAGRSEVVASCVGIAHCNAPGRLQTADDQALADRYVPIVMLKAQTEPCERSGEAYAPVDVDIVFGNPAITLNNADDLDPVRTAPEASDLFGLGEGNYIDLPNDPRQAGCHYEQDFDLLSESAVNVAYAHVATQEGTPGIALQYWFYYYFNDWNNNHESDFEMIQIIFDADSVEEALAEAPVEVGYSQHGGGEYAAWDSDKLLREGDHPIVYVAAGSHSNQFANENYIGRAEEDGVGFGCDDASGESVRVDLSAVVVPTTVGSASDEFAWIGFEGRWGQQVSGEFNGPTGPNTKRSWLEPFGWQEDLRSSNVEVPAGKTVGPSPVNAFCGVVAFASNIVLAFIAERPWMALIGAVLIIGGGVTTAARTSYELIPIPLRRRRKLGQIIRGAFFVVRQRFFIFFGISAAFIPAGMIASALQALLANNPPLEPFFELSDTPKLGPLIIGITIGATVFSIAYIIAIAGITAALADMEAGRDVTILGPYRSMLRRVGDLAPARLRAIGIIVLLSISVIGLPWALRKSVQWLFLEQAILLDGVDGKSAAGASAQVVDGNWLRAFSISALLGATGIAAGPLITAPLLLFTSTPLELLNAISSLIYMTVVPVVAVGLALLYFDLKASHDEGSANNGE